MSGFKCPHARPQVAHQTVLKLVKMHSTFRPTFLERQNVATVPLVGYHLHDVPLQETLGALSH